jgi:hypothetical protein
MGSINFRLFLLGLAILAGFVLGFSQILPDLTVQSVATPDGIVTTITGSR